MSLGTRWEERGRRDKLGEHAMIAVVHNNRRSQVVPEGKFVVYDDQRVLFLSATFPDPSFPEMAFLFVSPS